MPVSAHMTKGDPMPEASLAHLWRALQRGFNLSATAAEALANGDAGLGRRFLILAEAQYAHIATLMAASDMTRSERQEMRLELAQLTESVAKLRQQINKRYVVLVIHDVDLTRGSLVMALEHDGYIVLAAESVEKGMQIAVSYAANLHLALLGARLRREPQGLEFYERVTRMRPGIGVAMVVGPADREPIPGSTAIIREPFHTLRFLREIRRLLGIHEGPGSVQGRVQKDRIGRHISQPTAVEEGRNVTNPDILRKEMMAAGQRLLNALQLEIDFGRMHAENPGEEARVQWRNARALVDISQAEYDTASERYREAMRAEKLPPAPPASEKTILLLEDDRMVRSLLKSMLESRGHAVLEAANGNEAAVCCQQHQGRIDLVIADVVLRSGSYGMEVAEHLAGLRPTPAILFISGYPLEQLTNRGLLNPDSLPFRKTSFLQKPFSRAALETQVHQLTSSDDST
jgi:CheY-like chemotaxis protein